MQQGASPFVLRSAVLGACAVAIVCLSGCAATPEKASPSSMRTLIPSGSLHGGHQPIVGAHIFVYAANSTGGYGSASTSLIQPGVGTANDPSMGNYVTTDMAGSFSYAGTVVCPTPTTQVYLLAMGGNSQHSLRPPTAQSPSWLRLGAAPI